MSLMSAASLPTTTAASPRTTPFRFPGGATATLLCEGDGWVALGVEGELDTHDKYAIIDVLTPFVLAGCRRIHVDAGALAFVDVAALRAFARVRWFLQRDGGTLTIDGLGAVAAQTWALLTVPAAGRIS